MSPIFNLDESPILIDGGFLRFIFITAKSVSKSRPINLACSCSPEFRVIPIFSAFSITCALVEYSRLCS